jgi:thiol-disulfide isomerase/thioredoxin
MNIKLLPFFLILVTSVFTACQDKNNISESVVNTTKETKPVEQKLPTFHLKTSNDKNITIEVTKDGWNFKEYPNKVVLLNFFATWCPPCKAEIPHLNNLLEQFKDDLIVISVLVEQNKENSLVNDFILQHNIQYPITNSPVNFDLAGAVGGVDSIPAMFLFTKKGLVFQNYVGAVEETILSTDIQKALKK